MRSGSVRTWHDPVMSLTGHFVILPTPFALDGSVDVGSLRRVIRCSIEGGAAGLVALGVMGEAAFLDDGERELVLHAVLDEADSAVPVIVGVSDDDSAIVAERAARVTQLGVDAVMCLLPKDPARLVEHLGAAGAAAKGLVVQDYPLIGHPVVAADRLSAAIGELPNVVALKAEDPPTTAKIAAVAAVHPSLPQLGGLGGLMAYWELRAGSAGTMTGFAYPELLARLVQLAGAGDDDAARAVYEQILPALVWEAQPVVGLALRKHLLHARGLIDDPRLRAPSPALPAAAGEAREVERRTTPLLASAAATRPG